MSTIVRPAALSSWRRAMTSAPAWLSRLPVGSSARIRAGSVTSARATATRCCWPPDSSVGSWSSRSPIPRRSSAALARAARSAPRDALVEERRRDVVERASCAAAGCTTGRRSRCSGCGRRASPSSSRSATGRAGQAVAAARRAVEAAEDVHHRGLARARRPDDRDELAGIDLEADVGERRAPASGPCRRRG